MERKIPKNVRQIGNVSDNPKIYVEDYVDTFFSHMCEKGKENPVGAFLVGEMVREEDRDYMFIHGAIQMTGITKKDRQYVVEDGVLRSALKECKEFFGNASLVGWFLCAPDLVMEADHQMKKTQEKLFLKKSSLFVMKDPDSKEENFYIYKYNDLMELGGHYIYYEKNPSMQNYMISKRKQNGVTPSESVEDRAAKDFRSIVQEKEAAKHGKFTGKLLYVASAVLVLIVAAMGITTLNNYDKMRSVQTSISQLNKKNDDSSSKEADPQTDVSTDASQNQESSSQETAVGSDDIDTTSGNDTGTSTGNAGDEEVPQGDEGTNPLNQVYVVEEGDTLAIISVKQYGDISHVDAICRMNGLKNGNLIYEGQKLLLP